MAKPEAFSPHLHRALTFVKIANDGGVYPSAAHLDAYATRPEPRPSTQVSATSALWASAASQLMGIAREGDPVATYMLDVGWLNWRGRGLEVSALGLGLVHGVQALPQSRPDRGVVLSPSDPARYETLVRSMTSAGAGMLADPYLRSEFLDLLVEGTALTRLLLSKGVKQQGRKLIALALHRLQSEQVALPEVRVSADRLFHDRYLLHEDGAVDLIGTSMSNLDFNLTALVPLPDTVRTQVGTFLQDLWDGAEPIEPEPPRTEPAKPPTDPEPASS